MSSYYFTFGQDHVHKVDAFIWDKDIVCVIQSQSYGEARERMFANFGPKWAFQYEHEPDLTHFPRGKKELT